jgi:hypothetical protein
METSIQRQETSKEILELKLNIFKIKNSLEGFKGRFEDAEERISKFEVGQKKLSIRNRKKNS